MTNVGPANDPDRYQLLELKSSGGEGQVFRGSIEIDGARISVAVKIIHPSRVGDMAEWRRRWQRQAELLRSLDHPGLVKVREVFEGPLAHEVGRADRSTNTLYLVMNWVEGPTLEEWVSRNPNRDLLDSARVLGKLASAVDYLHSGAVTGNPVLHRDIKPANVVLAANGPVLVDFGFTRVLANQPMTMVGTPAYVPPEVVSHGEHSTASDRYSLGATGYYMITGTVPTPGNRAAMVDLLTGAAGAEGRHDIAAHVLSMMDPEPARRPSAAVAWAQQLGAAAVSDAAPTMVHPNPRPLAPPVAPRTTSALLPPPATTFSHPSPSTHISTPRPAAPADPPLLPASDVVRRRGRGRGRLLVAVGVLLALLAGGLGYLTLAGRDDASSASVPATTISNEEDVGVATVPASSATPSAPSTTIAPATTEALIQLPRLAGMAIDQALATLEDRGLVAEVTEAEGPGPYGKVQASEPATGSEVAAGSTVVLTVAKQPAAMIDVVGLNFAAARALLADYEIEATIVEVLGAEGATSDTVVDQVPKLGEAFSATVALSVERQPTITYLADLELVDRSVDSFEAGQAQVSGSVYTRSVMIDPYGSRVGYVEYDLARGHRILRGLLGLRDDVRADSIYRVEIFLDGAKISEQDVGLGQTVPIELDVGGVLRLRVQVTDLAYQELSGRFYVVLADTRLLGLPSEVPVPAE